MVHYVGGVKFVANQFSKLFFKPTSLKTAHAFYQLAKHIPCSTLLMCQVSKCIIFFLSNFR